MGVPEPNWADPAVLTAIEQAFNAAWPVIRAHEAGADKARMAELGMMLSHRIIEMASGGVTDPQELRKLALESFPLAASSEVRGQECRPQSAPRRNWRERAAPS